ncbi:non-ribosomal peptide synthetase [Acetivibrio cellulolyticus]|uniref:non-ribosomal peptide synthetase n=1 Tax=Acetivibrio cellulolyticus TaxID=35830 RepID=UPI0001E2F0A7|nr:non-ribosomal peptide synthetase [Acetivibrio cellulolyticus]
MSETMQNLAHEVGKTNKEKSYWTKKLEGDLVRGTFPYDNIPGIEKKQTTQSLQFDISGYLFEKLNNLSNKSMDNLFAILSACVASLLYRYTGNMDFITAFPIHKQDREGEFVNTFLVQRSQFNHTSTFKDILISTKKTVAEACENANFPLDRLLETLDGNSDSNSSYTIDTVVLLENIHDKAYIKQLRPNLIVSFKKMEDCIVGTLEFNSILYENSTVESIADRLLCLMQKVVADVNIFVGSIDIFSEEEKMQMLAFNQTSVDFPRSMTFIELFEKQAAEYPDKTVLVSGEEKMTYKELSEKANQIARTLRRLGIKPNSVVGIHLEQCANMVIGVLGVLKAGGAYLPLEQTLPKERLQYIIEDSGMEVLLSNQSLAEKILFKGKILDINDAEIYKESTSNLELTGKYMDMAYIIYTSGTTGMPKGVQIENHSLVNYINWFSEYNNIGIEDKTVLLSSFCYDLGYTAVYTALSKGCELHILNRNSYSNPDEVLNYIKDNKITYIKLTPSLFNVIVNSDKFSSPMLCDSLRLVVLGGEKIGFENIRKFNKSYPQTEIMNHYGPTETTIGCIASKLDLNNLQAFERRSIIGRPINNMKIHILNKSMQLLPIGVPGEIVIEGEGVARGYVNSNELTAEKFIWEPSISEDRMYRTGDLGRWMPDGSIEFIGRIDNQIKIRGFRVELSEIQSKLTGIEGIKEALVTFGDDGKGDKYLCAYFVAHGEIKVSTIREALIKVLPDYMVPSYFVQLEKIPLTPNGKVDLRKLPEPNGYTDTEYEAPTNELEEKFASIWQDVLGVEKIGINDNFFDLGGHSLKATVLVSRIHKEMNIEIPIMEVFGKPTIKEMAAFIKEADKSIYLSIAPSEKRDYYPLSSAQKRTYILTCLEENSTAYNKPGTVMIEGNLDRVRVESALIKLIERHETLRTTFHIVDDEPMQQVHDKAEFHIDYFEDEEDNVPLIIEKLIKPFDLSKAPLLRIALIKVKEDKHIMMYDMHHIISDGTSMKIIIQEFAEFYRGKELPQLRIQYKDYSIWQNKMFEEGVMKKQEEYWRELLNGELPVLNLPADFSRPALQSFEGARLEFETGLEIKQKVNSLARESGSTMFMVLLAAYNILLMKYTGQEDIIVGSPIAGRPHADLESMVGIFINTLAMRNRPCGEKTFKAFLNEVKENALKAYANQDYQFEELVEKLGIRRDMSRNPLFDVMLIMQNTGTADIELEDLKLKSYASDSGISKFDLTFDAVETNDSIRLSVEYATKLFKKETIQRMGNHYIRILEEVIKNPDIKLSQIDMLSFDEKDQIINKFNDTKAEYTKDKTINQLFEEQVERTPDKTAVVFEDKYMTYRELNEKSNQLARKLKEKGIEPDCIVGIMVERSFEMFIGILGILKAGGAYLPLDPDYPEERINYMLTDSCAKIVLTQKELLKNIKTDAEIIELDDRAIYELESTNLSQVNTHKDLAYVIYTSGSTGRPKGVMIEHGAVNNFVKGMTDKIEFNEGKTILNVTTISFDIFVLETVLALVKGLKVVTANKNQQTNPHELKELIQKNKIEMLQMTPSRMQTLINENDNLDFLKSVKEIMIGGEIFNEVLFNKLRNQKSFKIYNMYGPTETTVWSAVSDLTDAKKTDIGTPIANTMIYMIDKNNNIQPVGIPGELCIAGDGLARGYLNRLELSDEKFVQNPFVRGDKMYRTGDLARWMSDGSIEFIGRIDNQVKIRGYRIELGEIETCLLKHRAVKEALVVDRKDNLGVGYLCAYIVLEEELEISSLRKYLSEELPEYMIPSYFVQLEKLPLTPNGKLDRKKLPEVGGSFSTGTEYVAPTNETEEKLAKIWSEVLGREKIGINDNFFELGGHSLKATILASRLHKKMDIKIPLKAVFSRPTVKELADYIKEAEVSIYNSIEPSAKKEYYPLSSAQRRLFILNKLGDEGISYNLPGTVVIEGRIDRVQFEEAFKKLIERHEALRTSFDLVDGEPVQRINENADFQVEYYEEEEANATGKIKELIKPFDLEKAPLMRVALIKVEEDKHIMLYDMHHIISDGVSMNIITREFSEIYSGKELPQLRLQYRDYTLWQNRLFEEGVIKKQEDYWKETFKEEVPLLNLPTDFERPLVQSFEGNSLEFETSAQINNKIQSLAKETGTTVYMILLAAYNTFLMKYTGQEDIVVGSPIAGRPHADLENMVGMFVNTLAMRNRPCAEKSFEEFLYEVKENALKAYENQDYQFEELIEKLDIKRDTSRNPLFDVMFVLQNTGGEATELEGLRIRSYRTENNVSKYDLSIIAFEGKDRIHFRFEYRTKLFKEETIERMKVHFKKILEVVLDNVKIKLADIDMIAEEEKHIILNGFNNTEEEYPEEKCMHVLFEEQVERTPENVAAVYKEKQLSYSELNEKSNQLARVLRHKGVKPDSIVGIMLDRSIEMIIGIMGILKAGGAYLPIAADYPEDRIKYMLSDSSIKVLLTQKSLIKDLESDIEVIDLEDEEIFRGEATNLEPVTTASDLMYIIYTSGSTGKPKGVMIEHRSVVNFATWRIKAYGYTMDDVTLQMLSYSFDGFGANLFPTLVSGGRVVITANEFGMDPQYINTIIRQHKVTNMSIVPSMYSAILEYSGKDDLDTLRFVVLAGEKCDRQIIEESQARNPHIELINEYGPTENSITTTALIGIKPDNTSIIGTAISNNKLFIMDNYSGYKRIQPIGVWGELCISGDGLARGYLNQPEQTSQKFIPNPYIEGAKMYCTGDMARWMPDGTLEFFGRIDQQVKIRGFRIELGEIEEALLKHEKITEAVVIARNDNNVQNLCAYFISDVEFGIGELKEYLSAKLPYYMIPAYFVRIEKLPLTPNGKVDLKALPEPMNSLDEGTLYEAPVNDIEETISKIWEEVLVLNKVGTNSNFFDLGGNSMSLIKVHSNLDKIYPGILKITDLFSNPTVKKLAELITKKTRNPEENIKLIPVRLPEDYFSGDIHGVSQHICDFVIEKEILKGIRFIAETEKVDAVDVLLAVYIYLFADISGQEEIMIQTMVNTNDTVFPLNIDTGDIDSINSLIRAVGEKKPSLDGIDTFNVKELKSAVKDRNEFSILPAFFVKYLLTSQIEVMDYLDVLLKFDEAEASIYMEFSLSNRLSEEKGTKLMQSYIDLIELMVGKYIQELELQ